MAFLGVYPALTLQRPFDVAGTRIHLPVEVERTSFDPSSSSGAEINEHYLEPLGLTRQNVFIFDLVPYYLANISVNRATGRSMADNVRLYEEATNTKTGIVIRPEGDAFLTYARELPGNLERLQDYLGQCRPRMLFTLGTEPAAFVRGMSFAEASSGVDRLLYGEPVTLDVLGVETQVVHLVHPHHFIKKTVKWTRRHADWCRDVGRQLVAATIQGRR